ncbi:PAS domain-containing sensor histidine kinase [Methanolobus sp. ZRKC2]|uniref:PAS domain S-box protein n=1 Tax=Methanolobus sp. ZRKC2 TaxID=3125783 RepID=UPI003251BB13
MNNSILNYNQLFILCGMCCPMPNSSDPKNDSVKQFMEETSYRDMIYELPAGVIQVDTDGNILFVNKAILELLGSPSEEVTKSFNIFTMEPLKKAGISSLVKDSILRDKEFISEFPYKTMWGKELYLRIKVKPVKDDHGKISGCIGTVEDISRRKQAEINLKRRVEIESLITDVSSVFIGSESDELDRVLSTALGFISKSIDAEYACLFELCGDGHFAVTYEWNTIETEKRDISVQKFSDKNMPWLVNRLKNENVVFISNTPDISDSEQENEFLKQLNVGSVLLISLSNHHGELVGFMTFSPLKEEKKWVMEFSQLLGLLGKIFMSSIERRRASWKLQQSEEKYRRIFREFHDIYFETDTKGTILTASPSVSKHLGYEPEELMGLPVDTVYRNTRDRFSLRSILSANGYVNDFEMDLLKKNGESISVSISAHCVHEDGSLSIVAGVVRNITERKNVILEMQQQKNLLASTFDSIPDLLAVIDRDLHVVLSNWKERDYITKEEKMSNPYCYNCFMHQDEPCDPCHAMEVFLTGNVKAVEKTNPIDGKIREIRVMPIFDENGNVSLVIEHIRDMTERKKVEQLAIDAKMAAEEANRTKSEFLANMSHELRTPLNSVIGFSEILLNEIFGPLNEKQKKHIGNISTSGKHLLSLINDILDLSKVEAGKMELNFEEFCLSILVGDVLAISGPLASKKNIVLSNEISAAIMVTADKSKIRQIFYNLVSNAIKFTPDNGYVTVGADSCNGIVNVFVEDTGVGISPGDMDKLFQPFKQIDSFYTRNYDGTGLGLALVKNLIEMQGGTIQVESEIGKGSKFIFTIPEYTNPL